MLVWHAHGAACHTASIQRLRNGPQRRSAGPLYLSHATAIGEMIEVTQAAFRAGIIWLTGEPLAVVAVDDPDGERPKPPSPRFPVWKPRYLDGGVFPFKNDR